MYCKTRDPGTGRCKEGHVSKLFAVRSDRMGQEHDVVLVDVNLVVYEVDLRVLLVDDLRRNAVYGGQRVELARGLRVFVPDGAQSLLQVHILLLEL